MPPSPAAPPAPAAGVNIVDLPPPAPPPPPTSSIKVSQMPASTAPAAPPPKGSAMDRMRQDLQRRAKVPGAPETPAPAKPAKPEPPAASQEPREGQEPAATPAEGETPQGTEPMPTTTTDPKGAPVGKPGKANPWKLVDQYKSRIGELEKQVAESKTGSLAEQAKKEYLTRIEALEKENKEALDELRFVNYTKHPEFVQKYQKPYVEAWNRAVAELSEITLTDPNTNIQRQANANDLLSVVNRPLGEAREQANTLFGDFADDVMAHRKELRNLFAAQQAALDEARKSGAEREKVQADITKKNTDELHKTVLETFQAENDAIRADPKYGKYVAPIEGDEEGNARLQKGFEMVDKAFEESPLDPRLTPEQRTIAARRHAALRNRAAAFGRLVSMIEKLESQKAALEKELGEYRETIPPTTGGSPSSGQPAAPSTAREAVFAALRAKAH